MTKIISKITLLLKKLICSFGVLDTEQRNVFPNKKLSERERGDIDHI